MKDLTLSQLKAICREYSLTPRELDSALECSDYSLMSYQEAEALAQDYIQDSIWAFNASFLARYLGCPVEAVEAIQATNKCESNNEVFLDWLKETGNTIEDFASDAISADGLGHFLSSYDGEYFEVPNSDLIVWRNN